MEGVPSSGGCLEPQVDSGGQCKPQETELFTALDLRAHFSRSHPPFSQLQATSATNSNSPAWKFSLLFLAINNSGGYAHINFFFSFSASDMRKLEIFVQTLSLRRKTEKG